MFFLSKLFSFGVVLVINDFRDEFTGDSRRVSRQIPEMFFAHIYSFF